MYDTYTRMLYELFHNSSLFSDLKTLISNGESTLARLDSGLILLQKILSVGVFGLGFLASLISKFVDFKPILQHLDILNNYWMFILPIVTLVILYVSYKISEKVYLKKEF